MARAPVPIFSGCINFLAEESEGLLLAFEMSQQLKVDIALMSNRQQQRQSVELPNGQQAALGRSN